MSNPEILIPEGVDVNHAIVGNNLPERYSIDPNYKLIVPNSLGKLEKVNSGIKVIRPEDDTSILKPSAEQITSLAFEETSIKPASARSSSEIAFAQVNLGKFLERQFDLTNEPQLKSVVRNLVLIANRKPIPKIYIKDTTTTTKEKTYYDKYADQQRVYEVTAPSPLETITTKLVEIATEPSFENSKTSREILDLTLKLVKNYRELSGNQSLSEMPILTSKILDAMQSNRIWFRYNRFSMYDILSEMSIPDTFSIDLLNNMQHQKDLRHPLAFYLTESVYNKEPDSNWIRNQVEKRDELLNMLSATPQELFDNYKIFQELSSQIVFYRDFDKQSTEGPIGKVGIEIEFSGSDDLTSGYRDPEGWVTGVDALGNKEVRRANNALYYDQRYQDSVSHLVRYLHNNAGHLSSLHIHLDSVLHPAIPDIGNLLLNEKGIIWDKKYNDETDTYTNEIRGLIVPTYDAQTLDPQIFCSLIELYIFASRPVDESSTALNLKEENYSLNQLIWGHICNHIKEPEGRLAALKVIEHFFTLKVVDTGSIYRTYEGEEPQKQAIAQVLFDSSYTKIQKDSLIVAMHEDHVDYSNYLDLEYASNFLSRLLEDDWSKPFKFINDSTRDGILINLFDVLVNKGEEKEADLLETFLHEYDNKDYINIRYLRFIAEHKDPHDIIKFYNIIKSDESKQDEFFSLIKEFADDGLVASLIDRVIVDSVEGNYDEQLAYEKLLDPRIWELIYKFGKKNTIETLLAPHTLRWSHPQFVAKVLDFISNQTEQQDETIELLTKAYFKVNLFHYNDDVGIRTRKLIKEKANANCALTIVDNFTPYKIGRWMLPYSDELLSIVEEKGDLRSAGEISSIISDVLEHPDYYNTPGTEQLLNRAFNILEKEVSAGSGTNIAQLLVCGDFRRNYPEYSERAWGYVSSLVSRGTNQKNEITNNLSYWISEESYEYLEDFDMACSLITSQEHGGFTEADNISSSFSYRWSHIRESQLLDFIFNRNYDLCPPDIKASILNNLHHALTSGYISDQYREKTTKFISDHRYIYIA